MQIFPDAMTGKISNHAESIGFQVFLNCTGYVTDAVVYPYHFKSFEEALFRYPDESVCFLTDAPNPEGSSRIAMKSIDICSTVYGDDIAFPKNNAGRDVMLDAPATIDQKQFTELQIKLDLK